MSAISRRVVAEDGAVQSVPVALCEPAPAWDGWWCVEGTQHTSMSARRVVLAWAVERGIAVAEILAPGEPTRAEVVVSGVAEVVRLTACLGRATASLEETERALYLRLGALETAAREYVAAVDAVDDAGTLPAPRLGAVGVAMFSRDAARARLLAAIEGAS